MNEHQILVGLAGVLTAAAPVLFGVIGETDLASAPGSSTFP